MPDRAVTLGEIEGLIAERKRAFSPSLQSKFEGDIRARRARFLSSITLRTAFVYNLFLLGDYLLAPDTLWLSTILHLTVVTPWMLYVAHVLPSVVSSRWREGLASSISIAIVAQILVIFALTRSPDAAHYFYFAPVTLLSVTSLQRTDAACAIRTAAIVLVLIVAAMLYRPQLPFPIAFVHCMTFAVCAAVVVNSNHLVTREQRRHYLLALRDRLRAERSDSNANLDALTGLGNRRYLDKCEANLWNDGNSRVAAIMFDVDHFKSFNDNYGHTRGDACLKRIAACATAELRTTTDVAVRFGGEEFLLLLVDADATVAEIVAERIRATIAALGIPHEGSPCGVVTASFGFASVLTCDAPLVTLIEMANSALYDAKRAGRNLTRRYGQSQQPRAA